MMQDYTCYRIPHCVAKWTSLLWYNWNTTFLLTTRCGKATHLDQGQTNSTVWCTVSKGTYCFIWKLQTKVTKYGIKIKKKTIMV